MWKIYFRMGKSTFYETPTDICQFGTFCRKAIFYLDPEKKGKENSDNMNIHLQELLRACEWLAQNMCARLGDLMNIYDVIICFHR